MQAAVQLTFHSFTANSLQNLSGDALSPLHFVLYFVSRFKFLKRTDSTPTPWNQQVKSRLL
jgi:hypothetical protein